MAALLIEKDFMHVTFASFVGLLVVLVCGSQLFADWIILEQAWQALEQAHKAGSVLGVQYWGVVQDAHRINCFAEGLGVLFGVKLFADALR